MVFLCNSELCASGGKSKRGNIDFSFYGADLPGGSDSSPMAFGTYRNLAELCRNFGAGRNHVICDFEEIVSQISELMVVWQVHCCTKLFESSEECSLRVF